MSGAPARAASPRPARRGRRAVLAAGALLAVAGCVAPSAEAARARFDTRLFALIPSPGFPANAYAAPDGDVYEGTYENPGGGSLPSRVLHFSPTGALLGSSVVRGQNLSGAQGVQVATSDGSGRLILLDKDPPRALTLDVATDRQDVYATWPEGSIPNHAAWGPDGSLYVTDYGKPILWRVPPGGGTPEKWLEDPRFDGGMFGMTGISLTPDRKSLYVGMQSEMGGNAGNPATGRIFKIPIGADGKAGPPAQFWESQALDGPDAFGVAASGNVYVALLLVNQLAEIAPDGKEITRFPAAGAGGANGSAVPFDNPSNVRFSGDRLLVANQSYVMGDTTHQAILDVYAGEPGLPELIPPGPAAPVPPRNDARKRDLAARAAARKRSARAQRTARRHHR